MKQVTEEKDIYGQNLFSIYTLFYQYRLFSTHSVLLNFYMNLASNTASGVA